MVWPTTRDDEVFDLLVELGADDAQLRQIGPDLALLEWTSEQISRVVGDNQGNVGAAIAIHLAT